MRALLKAMLPDATAARLAEIMTQLEMPDHDGMPLQELAQKMADVLQGWGGDVPTSDSTTRSRDVNLVHVLNADSSSKV